MTNFDLVKEFHKKFGLASDMDVDDDPKLVELRLNLISEEYTKSVPRSPVVLSMTWQKNYVTCFTWPTGFIAFGMTLISVLPKSIART